MEARHVSDRGLVEIASKEGLVPAPYFCSAGVYTFGVGHTAAAGDPDPQRMPREMPEGAALEQAIADAIALFRHDVAQYEARVLRAVQRPLAQHQLDALVSWDINTGGASWRHPTTRQPAQLIQQINRGDMSGDGFMGWLRPAEIRGRREAEQALFRTGSYQRETVPIYRTDGNYRLRGVIAHMPAAELLERLKGPSYVPREKLSLLARFLLAIIERMGK